MLLVWPIIATELMKRGVIHSIFIRIIWNCSGLSSGKSRKMEFFWALTSSLRPENTLVGLRHWSTIRGPVEILGYQKVLVLYSVGSGAKFTFVFSSMSRAANAFIG